ncbi:hypothetical protein V5O48_016648 [Marasmius crinis-equi]|uniref:Uncharacterized protein n=1 Tax=Marasmius crinis-equi TaxID=585013 RepID=A0ABR3ERA0_9AGAR
MSSPFPSVDMQTPNIQRDIVHEAQSFDSFPSSYVWAWLGLAVLVLLYKYCRTFLLPCLTLSELENALKLLRLAYRNTTQNCSVGHGELVDAEVVDCCEWSVIADNYLNLNIAASKIHEKHLQESIWWKYVGINPELMPEIARWYEDSEVLKRKILKAQVKDKQNRFEAERYRRQSARRTSAYSFNTPAYESPFRYHRDNAAYSSIEGELRPAILHELARLIL